MLASEISTLYALAHELFYLGVDDSPIYSDHFTALNREVFHRANILFHHKPSTIDEEASLCLSLLMGYNATLYDDGDKQERIHEILERCWKILDYLPASLLKCQLLVAGYAEVFDRNLLDQAHAIINTWVGREWTDTERETVEYLKSLEENPYPHWEIAD
ncbi:UpxZ family transcription anti-terminator antagonist [Oscillospiraceae bacterium N12]|jgi:hypothetical protein|uniref:UpxZ family transcription anti-terminator antagonist n=1 Tax=Jilunia laotingensis TaxID=2763675 RepID=A0A926F8L9_9BACT|nr:UpxZ family transcription anti-terminator antagonist [Jilunia laotingensis]MBC8594842.1 UpxZ family transcription anti-terminator antagonist [Jilunia laotingensis]